MSVLRAGGRGIALLALAGVLSACGSAPPKSPPPETKVVVENHGTAGQASNPPRRSPYAPAQEDLSKRGNYVAGGLYAPGVPDSAPVGGIPDVDLIPEPEVRDEPRSRYGNRSPYTVLGKRYTVLDSAKGYDETGIASYYGNKFHGRRTSSLEVYDMYAFSAAHKTLPLPSYARVTNLANGESVVVRVNDRGPFHEGRIIDLSYAAAVKLGIHQTGTARVEVRALVPGEAGPATQVAAAAPASGMDTLVAALPDAATTIAAPVALPPDPVVVQVASFSTRPNAERALAQLQAAGIEGGQLLDFVINGQTWWRLRVGPVAGATAAGLADRIAGLGFGQPQLLRE